MKLLYEHQDKNYSYHVGVEIDPKGKLIISDWALGDVIKKTHIDSDIEHFIKIKKSDIHAFLCGCCIYMDKKNPSRNLSDDQIISLLSSLFQGNKATLQEMKEILTKNNIPFDFQVW